jgi:hypothetical protein
MRAVAGQQFVSLTLYDSSYKGCVFDIINGTITLSTNATGTITSVGAGIYRCSIVAAVVAGTVFRDINLSNSGSTLVPSYVGTGSNTFDIWGAQLEAVTYQTTPSTYYPTTTAAYYGPRLVYDPVTLASQGILVEEARTNSWLQSGDFATTWTLTGATVTTNGVVSPDGTSNMDTLVEDSGSSTHRAAQTITTTAAAWTMSCYARARNRSWLYFRIADSGAVNRTAFFNVSTGVVGTLGTGFTASIQSVGNGIYRCIATMATAYAGAGTTVIGASDNGSNEVYTGNGLAALDIWGAQLELGTGASSPIPTTTAAVTRAADAASIDGLTIPYPLTLNAEVTTGAAVASSVLFAQVDNGTVGQRVLLNTTASSLAGAVSAGGATQGSINAPGVLAANTGYKVAVRALVDNFRMARGGTLGDADTSFSYPTTATNIRIGWNNISLQPNAAISRIRIYNRALTDAELQAITA